MTQYELNETLYYHSLWLDNKGGVQADLSNKNLSHLDLKWKNLTQANLTNADLTGALLTQSVLVSANLQGTIFKDTILTEAILYNTTLKDAILTGANVTDMYKFGLINFSGGSTGKLAVYDAKNDLIHCGCWIGTLENFEKSVYNKYKFGFELTSYILEIQKLRAFKKHYELVKELSF